MRHLVVLFLLASACTRAPIQLPGIPLDLDPSLAVQARHGNAGHACPVEGGVYSARHVFLNVYGGYEGATWSQIQERDGELVVLNGRLEVIGENAFFDMVALGLKDVHERAITYLPKGTAQVGEDVFWFEYDLRTQKNALRSRRRVAKVLRVVAHHYILDAPPTSGSSGGCLINGKGEAVGLVVSRWDTLDKKSVGAAILFPEL